MPTQMTQEESDQYLAEETELRRKGVRSAEEYNDAVNDAAVNQKGYSAEMRAATQQLKKSFTELGSSMIKGDSGASVYNNTLASTSKTVSTFAGKFGPWGKAIGAVIDVGTKWIIAANVQADELFKNYQDLSRSGLSTGMNDTFKNLQDMGYTMKEIANMGAIMKENSAQLANLGGTAAQGAETFAKAGKQIQQSEVGNQFKRMGMTVDDINKGMAGYLKMQQTSGSTSIKNSTDLAVGAAAYIEQQDKLTKLTGKTAEQQNDIYQQAMATQQFAITQYQLEQKGDAESLALAARNRELMVQSAKLGPQNAAAMAKFLSGSLNSKEAQQFQRTYPQAAEMIRSGVKDSSKIVSQMGTDGKEYLASVGGAAKAGVADSIGLSVGETVKLVGSATDQMADREIQAKKEQADQKTGKDGAVDSMVDLTNSQRNQTQTTDMWTNKAVPAATAGMAAFSKGIEGATSALGRIGGREGRIGGGGTWTGGAVPSAIAPVAGGGVAPTAAPTAAPTPTAPTVAPAGKGLSGKDLSGVNDGLAGAIRKAAADYNAMTGKNVVVTSAYRSPADQQRMYDNYKSGKSPFPAAKPGNSLHEKGGAVDVSETIANDLDKMGLLAKYGLSRPVPRDPVHIQQAATGGILSGPNSGFEAMLHGTEAVVPLPDGKTVPVQMSGGDNGGDQEQISLLSQELDKLDALVRIMAKQNDVSNRILQKQS